MSVGGWGDLGNKCAPWPGRGKGRGMQVYGGNGAFCSSAASLRRAATGNKAIDAMLSATAQGPKRVCRGAVQRLPPFNKLMEDIAVLATAVQVPRTADQTKV